MQQRKTTLRGFYHNGEGVNKDLEEAARWFKKAAERGDALIQCSLGGCYMLGQGVERDLTTAVKWYRKPADQGNAQAQHSLGPA